MLGTVHWAVCKNQNLPIHGSNSAESHSSIVRRKCWAGAPEVTGQGLAAIRNPTVGISSFAILCVLACLPSHSERVPQPAAQEPSLL